MKSIIKVKRAVYYGYSLHLNTEKDGEYTCEYALGFRPNGLHDSEGQFAVIAPRSSAWHDICEIRKKSKVGDEFIISLEDFIEKYV